MNLKKRNIFGKIKLTRKEKEKREKEKRQKSQRIFYHSSPTWWFLKMFRCQMQALLFRHIINVTTLILKRFYSNCRFFLAKYWTNRFFSIVYSCILPHFKIQGWSRYNPKPYPIRKQKMTLLRHVQSAVLMQLNFKPKYLCHLMHYWYLKKVFFCLTVHEMFTQFHCQSKVRYPDIYQYAFHALSKRLKIGSNFQPITTSITVPKLTETEEKHWGCH